MEEVKTLTLTQSSLPLVQLWGGRLQLDAFQSTLHKQIVQLGPLGGMESFRPPRQSYPGGPLSIHLSGLSLSFHFVRDSRTRRPTQLRFFTASKQLYGLHVYRDLAKYVNCGRLIGCHARAEKLWNCSRADLLSSPARALSNIKYPAVDA
jgi:hypothetical protein